MSTASSFFKDFSQKHSGKELELEQASIRIIFAVLILVYTIGCYVYNWVGGVPIEVIYASVGLCISSIALLTSIILCKRIATAHRVVGVIVDAIFGTFMLIYGGLATASFYGAYIWVALANGVRYGRKFLYGVTIFSIACFSIALTFSDFWQQNLGMGIGLLLWLLVLPMYISKLLNKLELATFEANQANKAKSEFLANMSHEIRTPLTAIIGFAESSLDSNQTKQERMSAINTIVHSGNHLLGVVNDILDFSKIEANKLDTENTPLNLIQLLNDVESLIRNLAEEKNIEFKLTHEFPLPLTISSDSLRLKQILFNLCSNAVKFTDTGSVNIHVNSDSQTHRIVFSVEDTGIGMSTDQVKKLFQPFKQADSGITRRFGGTGLGLSISKKLVDLLNGSLKVESQPGKGTHFEVAFDIGSIENQVHINNEEELKQHYPKQIEATGKKKVSGTILIAEDNENNQALFMLLLRRMGAQVSIAENGKIAFEMAQQGHYDLIYMDMQMPIMSGIESVRLLRQNNYHGPIVALTANVSKEDKARCLEAGFDNFLSKPVLRNQLHRMTAKYLSIDNTITEENAALNSELLIEEPEFIDLVSKFVGGLADIIQTIEQEYHENNMDALKASLHSLKGVGGGMGYPLLSELCEKTEFQIMCNNMIEVENLIRELRHTCNRINTGLDAYNQCA